MLLSKGRVNYDREKADKIMFNGRLIMMEGEALAQAIAIKGGYTKNAAYLIWKEQELGSLKKGKIADIVVFEDDFLGVPDEALKDVRVYMTIANGETVYQREQ